MSNDLYTYTGYLVVWYIKYIFVPFGVAVSARIFVDKVLQPQPGKQRKKRFNKNRLK